MKSIRNLSFPKKLLLVIAATSLPTLFLACAALIAHDVFSFRSGLESDLRSLAEVVGANSAGAVAFDDSLAGTESLQSLRQRESILSAALYRKDGSRLSEYRRHGSELPPPAMAQPTGTKWIDRELVVVQDVLIGGEAIGKLYVRSDTSALLARIRETAWIGSLAMLAAALLGLIASSRLQRIVTDPVLALARAAREAGDRRQYGIRVEKQADDEIGALTDHFNSMLEQIQARDASLRMIQDELEAHVATLESEIRHRKEAESALTESEERLRQAQKMEAVGLLAGGIAHDFNNILTVICGYSQMLAAHLPEGDPKRRQAIVVKEAGDRAAALTKQLLAFSRKQVLAPKIIDLGSVITDLAPMLRRLIGEQVRLEIEPGSASFKADRTQVEQVIINLAVNARDAMPQGGRLSIRSSIDDVAGSVDAAEVGVRHALLTIADDGQGMNAETKARIFEPFFTTKGVGEGTGLGLAMVYGVIRQTGGHIDVESEPGVGTTFRLRFPLSEAGTQPTRADSGAPSAREFAASGETILLVEDEGPVREFARQVLEGAGYRVIEARDPIEARGIVAVHDGPLDLVLTDMVMPNGNGRDVVRYVHSRFPGLPAVYMSGYVHSEIARDGFLDPQTNFISKPFTEIALLERLRETLGQAPSPSS